MGTTGGRAATCCTSCRMLVDCVFSRSERTWVRTVDSLTPLWAATSCTSMPSHSAPGLVWGDCRIGNMMFDANYDLIAVMDWEQPSLGGSLNDLGWWITLGGQMHGASGFSGKHLEGMGSRQDTIDLWESVSGMSAEGLEWYEDFTQLKMSCTGVRLDMLRGTDMVKAEFIRERLKI